MEKNNKSANFVGRFSVIQIGNSIIFGVLLSGN